MKTATTQMINGELGSSPSVDGSFELYVDSTTEVTGYAMKVQLICAAPVTAFDYDTKLLTCDTESTGDFTGRRFTFAQKDLTRKPAWADVSFSMDGTGADWLDDTGTETLFTLRAAGFEQGFPSPGYADLTNILDNYLARGGIHAAAHGTRHTFDMNGAILLNIRNVGPNAYTPAMQQFQGWSAIRLMLKNAANLTYKSIIASASGRPATVRLGPVVEGLRTLDLVWPPDGTFHHFDADQEIQVAINAPILKYLLVWEKTTQIPVVENDAGGRDSTIEIYFNPARSYASGYEGPASLSDWTTFSSQGLAIDMELFVALEGLTQVSNAPLGGWRPDIAFGNPSSVSIPPSTSVEMVDPSFTHHWVGLLNYAGTAPEQFWTIDILGNQDALQVIIHTGGNQLQVIVQVETTSGTWASFGIAGDVPPAGYDDPDYYATLSVRHTASPEAICQALDGSHWTGRVRFSDLRNGSPDLIWNGGTPGPSATIAVAAAYMPHAVRNIDITVTPSTNATTVEAGSERGHFS